MTSAQHLFHRALEVWGADAQMDQCIEEMAELTVELQHRKRGRTNHAAEEVADVLIMAAQMRILVGESAVDAVYREKIKRLEGIL